MLRLPEALNLAPAGARLWATWLDRTPGFNGRIDYIHKCNIPSLFELEFEDGGPEYRGHEWYPSALEVRYGLRGLALLESKFVTWDDVAVSVLEPGACACWATSSLDGQALDLGSGPAWFAVETGRAVRTGGLVTVCAAADDLEIARDRARDWANDADPISRHQREYMAWFDSAPSFSCSDSLLNRMWAYRWFLLRRNLADPQRGSLRSPLFYEGRGLKMTDTPYDPQGWEFSKLITFSTPFHLLESRWRADPSPAYGEVLDLARHPRDDGLLQSLYVDRPSGVYTHFIPWAAWQLYLVHPNREWLREVAPALADDLHAWLRMYDSDGDLLPEIDRHGMTGKEFQPSFWWTPDGFLTDPGEPPNPVLERVDAACYLHMNASALADIFRELGDEGSATEFAGSAAGIRKSVLRLMWDPDLRFFCDLAPGHTRIPVRNVVGFDPFMAGIAGEEHLGVFAHLADPNAFASEYPIPSVSMDNPLYAPDATFSGKRIKGPHGCVWNGPTWPFANSTVLMSLAEASRRSEHRLDKLFAEIFYSNSRLMLLGGDSSRPEVVEHYNSETGTPISQEEDYFHSSWIDLVVTGVAGLRVSREMVVADPIDVGLDYLDLDGVVVRGRRLRITWRKRDRECPLDLEPGLMIWVDGRPVARSDTLARLEIAGLGSGR